MKLKDLHEEQDQYNFTQNMMLHYGRQEQPIDNIMFPACNSYKVESRKQENPKVKRFRLCLFAFSPIRVKIKRQKREMAAPGLHTTSLYRYKFNNK